MILAYYLMHIKSQKCTVLAKDQNRHISFLLAPIKVACPELWDWVTEDMALLDISLFLVTTY